MTETGENEKKDKDKTGGVTIYFLLAPGKTPDTCTESLSDAYDQSDESGLKPTWINTEKALAQKPTKTVIFYFYFIQLIASLDNLITYCLTGLCAYACATLLRRRCLILDLITDLFESACHVPRHPHGNENGHL